MSVSVGVCGGCVCVCEHGCEWRVCVEGVCEIHSSLVVNSW